MALIHADRVKETSTTTGTGTYDLAGVPTTDFQTFVAGIGNGNTCWYCAYEDDVGWEVGLGTVTDAAPDTLARTAIYSSSNGGAAVDWAAGTRTIFCTLPSARLTTLLDTLIGSTQGQIAYRGASTWDPLAVGTVGHVLRTGGAAANPEWGLPLRLVGNSQPTTDVASVDITGLSAFNVVLFSFVCQLTTLDADMVVRARVSGGTYRTLLTGASSGGDAANTSVGGVGRITNFGPASEKVMWIAYAEVSPGNTALDSSDAIQAINIAAGNHQVIWSSYDEIWDELSFIPTTGNIEGSTADQRGRFQVYGG